MFPRAHWGWGIGDEAVELGRCEGHGLSKSNFSGVDYSATTWPFGAVLLVIGPSFVFLVRSQDLQTANNHKPTRSGFCAFGL